MFELVYLKVYGSFRFLNWIDTIKNKKKDFCPCCVVAMHTKTHGENIKQPNQPGTKRSDEPFVCQKIQKFKIKFSFLQIKINEF